MKGFVLVAKDPGGSKTEIRFDFECSIIPAALPVSITTAEKPIAGAFSEFDGMCYSPS